MTTKHFVIFGAGILAGYLLVDYLRKNPIGTTLSQNDKIDLFEKAMSLVKR